MGHRRTNKLFTEIMRENYIDSADDFRTILLNKINRTLEEKKKQGKQVLYGDKDDDLDDVDKSELKGKHADRDDKDIDNDGDVDSSDKFLHKKRKAITKAMKKESRCLPCEEKQRRMQEMQMQEWAGTTPGTWGGLRKRGPGQRSAGANKLSAYKAQQKRSRKGGGTARATRLQPNAPTKPPGGSIGSSRRPTINAPMSITLKMGRKKA